MPADASIYSMIQPMRPQPGPLDMHMQGLQLKHMMDASSLSALQRQQLERGIQEEADTAAAYRDSGGDLKKVRELLYGRGLYKPAQAAEKAALDIEEKRAGIDKNKAELLKKSLEIHRDQLAGIDTPQAAAQWVMSGFNDPNLSPIMQRLGGPQELIARIPQDPKAFQEWKLKNGLGIEKVMELTAPKVQVTNLGGRSVLVDTNARSAGFDPKVNLTHTMTPGEVATDSRGWAQINLDAQKANRPTYDSERGAYVPQAVQVGVGGRGAPRPASTSPAGQSQPQSQPQPQPAPGGAVPVPGLPPKASDGKLTETQGAATAFGMRASEAHKILSALEEEGTTNTGIIKSAVAGAAGLTPFIGDKLENAAGSVMNTVPGALGGPNAAQQRTEQARRDFVNAVLRKESGAVISPAEFENASRQYFPQPGDDATVIEQKRRNRETSIKALGVQAGPGAKNIPTVETNPYKPKGGGVDVSKLSDAELLRELGLSR